MKITIQKYLKSTDTDRSDNLFSTNLTFVDEIIFERALEHATPIYKDEWQKEDNVESLGDGVYDLEFSMGMDEKTRILQQNIYQLFGNVETRATTTREKYFVLCENTNLKKPCGIISLDTLKADEDTGRVTFSYIGIGKEAVLWMQWLKLQSLGFGGEPFGMNEIPWEFLYMPEWHLKDRGPYLFYQSNLILTTLGQPAKVRAEMQAQLFQDGLNRGYSVWEGLKSFIITLGFRIRVSFLGFDLANRHPRFQLTFYWRNQTINNVGELPRFKKHEKSIEFSTAKWIFLPTGQLTGTNSGDITYFIGILFSRSETFITDINTNNRIGFNPIKNVFQVLRGTTVVEIPVENVTRIEVGHHAKSWEPIRIGSTQVYNVNVAYARIIRANFDRILFERTRAQYFDLLEGACDRRNLILNVNDIDVAVGSRGTIDTKPFICDKINSYNDYNKHMDSDWRGIVNG